MKSTREAKPRGRRWIWALALTCPIWLPMAWQTNYYFGIPLTERARILREAREAYVRSRTRVSAPRGTPEFLTFGLVAGMTQAEVDAWLPQPQQVVRGLRQEMGEPRWPGTYTTYVFDHGPMWDPGPSAKPRFMSTEYVSVYFDQSGLSRKLSIRQYGDAHTFYDEFFEEFDLPEKGTQPD